MSLYWYSIENLDMGNPYVPPVVPGKPISRKTTPNPQKPQPKYVTAFPGGFASKAVVANVTQFTPQQNTKTTPTLPDYNPAPGATVQRNIHRAKPNTNNNNVTTVSQNMRTQPTLPDNNNLTAKGSQVQRKTPKPNNRTISSNGATAVVAKVTQTTL